MSSGGFPDFRHVAQARTPSDPEVPRWKKNKSKGYYGGAELNPPSVHASDASWPNVDGLSLLIPSLRVKQMLTCTHGYRRDDAAPPDIRDYDERRRELDDDRARPVHPEGAERSDGAQA